METVVVVLNLMLYFRSIDVSNSSLSFDPMQQGLFVIKLDCFFIRELFLSF